MSIAFVNRVEGSFGGSTPVASNATTSTAQHAAGNLLVAFITRDSATGITVTDTQGNTWHQAGSAVIQGTHRLEIWYAYNISGVGSNVVTAALTSGTAAYFLISVRNFSGFGASDPFDGSNGTTGKSTSISSGSVGVIGTEDVILAGMEADGQGITNGTGYTLDLFNGGIGDGRYFADEYHIVTAAESATATCASGAWGILAASFKSAPSGPSPALSAYIKPNKLRPRAFAPGL